MAEKYMYGIYFSKLLCFKYVFALKYCGLHQEPDAKALKKLLKVNYNNYNNIV